MSRIRQLYDFSEHAGKIDFVFVDASHRYQPAAKDTRTALELVAPGGLVVWHDYGYRAEGLRRVLDELSKTRRLRHIAGTSLVVYSSDGDASPD